MVNKQNYSYVAFFTKKDHFTRLKLRYPKHGDVSKVLRWLVQQVVDGKIQPTLSK